VLPLHQSPLGRISFQPRHYCLFTCSGPSVQDRPGSVRAGAARRPRGATGSPPLENSQVETRGAAGTINRMERITFTLAPNPPFRLDFTVGILRRRAENIVDRWDGRRYHRVLAIEGRAAEVTVEQIGPAEGPRVQVEVWGKKLGIDAKTRVIAVLEQLLGLRVNLRQFHRRVRDDARLGELCGPFLGAKPPRFPSVFEALVNAIACQQVTLSLGIQLLNKLAQNCGLRLQEDGRLTYAFPRPEELAELQPEQLRTLGFSLQKGHALVELARAVAEKRVDLDGLVKANDDDARAALRALRGVGRWSADYALLRGLGRLHVFPAGDVGARNSLQRWLAIPHTLDDAGVHSALEQWKGFEGLVYFHLLLRNLAARGHVRGITEKQDK
jgi:DNA-3-methyladenine glycosylase II